MQLCVLSAKMKLALSRSPLVLAVLALHLHLLFALLHDWRAALPLLALFVFIYAGILYARLLGPLISRHLKGLWTRMNCAFPQNIAIFTKIAIPSLLMLTFLLWLLIDSVGNRIRLRSLLGFFTFLCLCFSASIHPTKVNWQPVIGSIFLQVGVGILVLRWPPGSVGFQWASEKVVAFLDFTSNGTRFVYGFVANPPPICGMTAVFIFTALQIIVYFGAVVAILYHFGVMQFVLSRLAVVVQHTIGTTTAESANAAACIFLGQTESALLIGPSLVTMTDSEVHCVMTAGFACIAGSLFSAYISFGARPVHLLSATIMNAAISLGVSKLVWPELEQSKHRDVATLDFMQGRDKDETVLECISKAAVRALHFVASIGANLVVYIALLALLNAVLGWTGSLIGIHGLSFNKLLGFVFFPLAWAMGASDATDMKVSMDETMKVAELMGVKTVLNEFIAYRQLSEMMANGMLGPRARMVATFALCGFSNISMIGTQIGVLSAICPERTRTFAKVALRAFVAGVFSCFLTACIAGMLVDTPMTCKSTLANEKCLNVNELLQNNSTSF